MTISSTNNKVVYIGDSVKTSFSYTYRMDNDGDMNVYLNDVLQASGYAVNRNADNIGGNVIFDVAPASGVNITLLRIISQTQETDYVPYGPFPAESHEQALDKLTMLVQQLQEQVDRNTQAIGGSSGVDTTAPPFSANKAWKWDDGTDKKLINSTYDPDEQVANATAQANNAAGSAVSAAISENNAAASETRAHEWSENPEDVPVVPGEYSAHHWAIKAADNASGVASVNGRAGIVVLDSSDVSLQNCDNTSDANKPISTATQAALDLKADTTYVDSAIPPIAEESAIIFAIALG